jgi:hypothetical protein
MAPWIWKTGLGSSSHSTYLLVGQRSFCSVQELAVLVLNLARATYVIITEPFRTPGTLQQVIERAYRLPQEKTVHVAGFNLTLSIARSSIIQAPEGLCIILHT